MNKNDITDFSIKRFFKDDLLDFTKYPVKEIAEHFSSFTKYIRRNTIADLTIISNNLVRQEYKDLIITCMVNNKPYSYKSKYMPIILSMPVVLEKLLISSVFDIIPNRDLNHIYELYADIGINDKKLIHNVFITYPSVLKDFRDTRKGFDRDVWHLDNHSITDDRVNKSNKIATFDFRNIELDVNREYIKAFIKNRIGNTEMSISYIRSEKNNITRFCNFTGKDFCETSREDILRYKLDIKDLSYDTQNTLIHVIQELFNYLSIKKIFNGEIPIYKSDYIRNYSKKKISAVSDTVIFDIFRHLHELDEQDRLMYLVEYCTGLRISDVCQLKLDCLHSYEGKTFIATHVQKMNNNTANPIPQVLYNLLINRKNKILSINKDAVYLFPNSTNDGPCPTQVYSRHMKAYCEKFNIRNTDGSPYVFRSHDYRHTIATTCSNICNMSDEMIQLGILRHKNINMTHKYIERDNKGKAKKYLDFNFNFTEPDASVLSPVADGFCVYPTKLGSCPNADICLNCEFFRTSIDFLDVHKMHLEKINEQIEYFTSRGFLNNLATAKKTKETLEKIIKGLEGLDESTST